jgi:hypothetical protein
MICHEWVIKGEGDLSGLEILKNIRNICEVMGSRTGIPTDQNSMFL